MYISPQLVCSWHAVQALILPSKEIEMALTTFVNCTNVPVTLKQGMAGVFRDVCKLVPKAGQNGNLKPLGLNRKSVEIDKSATYLEYMMATGNKGETICVTFEECLENAVIRFVKVNENYKVECISRHEAKGKGGFRDVLGFMEKLWPKKTTLLV